ncbi:uncharacterized protein N7503_008956 [Penicillium pulvis]|uniref:uncharacterized protein n=1 Tax=Penicillium pulvis TaxID=1562058 RepID=UPI00254896C0|nr:uncharacterized protein N7503_008956 [Penicillium pulvis]KAJ5792978.1 hypothetical protein N7503_008956 [Penicillium pulvis]
MSQLIARAYKFWNYVPSLPAAVIFMLGFLALTGLHTWKMIKTKTWFCIPFTIGGIFECIGYLGRCIAHGNTTTMGPYILTNMFTLLGPTLFAATIYMTLGRLIRAIHAERLSVIKITRLTKLFVWGDVISFLVQGNSSTLSVLGYPGWAKVVVIIGLAIQLISFSIFWITSFVLERRIRRSPTLESLHTTVPWKKFLYMLYAVSTLIIIRSAFRVVEYVLGDTGYPLEHEWTLYIFDTVPMFVVMGLFYMWYPDMLKPCMQDGEALPFVHPYSSLHEPSK